MKSVILWLALLSAVHNASADLPIPMEYSSALWKAAVEKRRKSEYLVPTRIHAISRRLNGAGTVKSEEHEFFSIQYTSSGVAVIHLLHAVKNGRDVTEQNRQKLVSAREERKEFEKGKTPFDPDMQDRLTLGSPYREKEGDTDLLSFPFTLLSGEYRFTGIARITEQEGSPYDARYNPSPLPLFAQFLEIRMFFAAHGEHRYVVSNVTYRYAGSFLFFRQYGEGSIEIGGWIELPVKPRLE